MLGHDCSQVAIELHLSVGIDGGVSFLKGWPPMERDIERSESCTGIIHEVQSGNCLLRRKLAAKRDNERGGRVLDGHCGHSFSPPHAV